jgi:hypothetical protein
MQVRSQPAQSAYQAGIYSLVLEDCMVRLAPETNASLALKVQCLNGFLGVSALSSQKGLAPHV